MPKRKNTTRSDGRIAVQVYLGRDDDGKRMYKTVYGATQKEADEKALQIKLSMRKGIDVTAERDTFEDWAARWLKIKQTEIGSGQYNAYKPAVDSLNRAFGKAEICKLRTVDFQNYLIDQAACNEYTGKPSSTQTLRVRRIAAESVLQLAIDNRVLDYNPVSATKLPKGKPALQRRALTDIEQQWIVNTPHNMQTSAMIMMYAGLRRGELVALTWNDIDLDAGVIHINKAAECVKGRFIVKPSTKTEKGMRDVKMPDRLITYLKSQPRKNVLVSVSSRNTFHTESSWDRAWDTYLLDLNEKYGDFTFHRKKNGEPFKSKFDPEGMPFVISRFTPHWLRHTYATLLYLAGVDVLTAMRQLGHSDIKTTLGIYTHLDEIYKNKAVEKLNEYLDPKKDEDDAK